MEQLNSIAETKSLTRDEIKDEMKKRRGYTFASYSRLIRRHKSSVTRLADGEIGGELRQKFLTFFHFTEQEVPFRGAKS